MPRPIAPCGTETAYRRHLRVGETPCEPCKLAASEGKKARRDEKSREKVGFVTSILDAVRNAGSDGQRDRETVLKEAAETVRVAIAVTLGTDPTKLAPLLREQREIAKELEAVASGSKKEPSLADQLADARARRAANS